MFNVTMSCPRCKKPMIDLLSGFCETIVVYSCANCPILLDAVATTARKEIEAIHVAVNELKKRVKS